MTVRSMTAQEKRIIEIILVAVGLEPLYSTTKDPEPKTKPNIELNKRVRSEYSVG